jgi:photosystem II stability/assembly factor-like uncharacterized protein
MDGGKKWSGSSDGLNLKAYVITLAIDPAIPDTLYAGTLENGVYKRIDVGREWQAIDTGLTSLKVQSLTIDPATSTILYIATEDGLFKSLDGGEHWRKASNGMAAASVLCLVIDSITPATLYAGTDGGVFKSTDFGENWSNIGLEVNYVTALVIDPTSKTTLYAGTHDGVFKSTDGGKSWTVSNNGLTFTPIFIN